MTKAKTIRFRCFCFECETVDGKGEPIQAGEETGSPAREYDDEESNKGGAHRIAGAIERLLFGSRSG